MNTNPLECRELSRTVRALSSWKLWLSLLFFSLTALALLITIPAHRRLRALEYFDEQHTTYEFVEDENWLTMRLGSWAKGFRRIASIDLCVVSDKSLSCVARFPEIRELVADGHLSIRLGGEREGIHPLSESESRSLGNLHELTTLKLWLTDTDDRVIAELLAAKPSLETLELHSNCGRQTLAAICELPSLKELVIDGHITDEAFAGLPVAPNLAACSLRGAGTQCVDWLARCPQLRHLRFTRSLFAYFEEIDRIHRLESLAFDGPLHFLDSTPLTSLQNLRILEIHNDQLNMEFANSLHAISNLELIRVVEDEQHAAIRLFLRDESSLRGIFRSKPPKRP